MVWFQTACLRHRGHEHTQLQVHALWNHTSVADPGYGGRDPNPLEGTIPTCWNYGCTTEELCRFSGLDPHVVAAALHRFTVTTNTVPHAMARGQQHTHQVPRTGRCEQLHPCIPASFKDRIHPGPDIILSSNTSLPATHGQRAPSRASSGPRIASSSWAR